MKRVLFTATVRSHIGQFHQPYLEYFYQKGWEVHIACKNNFNVKSVDISCPCVFHDIAYERSPFARKNIQAYYQFKKLLESYHFDIIHCHTPVASVISRIAARGNRKSGTRVIYTAHGFHFYRGASLLNWLIFYPLEKYLSRYTDVLITINEEDYMHAKSKGFKADKTVKINGVGVDLSKFKPIDEAKKIELRKKYGFGVDQTIMLCAADLSYRKHQDLLLEAFALGSAAMPDALLVFAGTGDKEDEFKTLAQTLGISNKIRFLGYSRNVNDLMALSDMVISAARQEGLPLNIIEAMASGLPVIASDCRGNRDLVKNNVNGFITAPDDASDMMDKMLTLFSDPALRKQMGEEGHKMSSLYSLENVKDEMTILYDI